MRGAKYRAHARRPFPDLPVECAGSCTGGLRLQHAPSRCRSSVGRSSQRSAESANHCLTGLTKSKPKQSATMSMNQFGRTGAYRYIHRLSVFSFATASLGWDGQTKLLIGDLLQLRRNAQPKDQQNDMPAHIRSAYLQHAVNRRNFTLMHMRHRYASNRFHMSLKFQQCMFRRGDIVSDTTRRQSIRRFEYRSIWNW